MSAFRFGGMTLDPHTATDPSSGKSITYVYRTDVHPESLVALVSDAGLYLQRAYRDLDPDVLAAELARRVSTAPV